MMGISTNLGASIEMDCPACKLPVSVKQTTYAEDICHCPFCGGSLTEEQMLSTLEEDIQRLEAELKEYKAGKRDCVYLLGALDQAADHLRRKHIFNTADK